MPKFPLRPFDHPRLAPDGTLAEDAPCIHCGYNLRTLALNAFCAECGQPVVVSTNGYRLCNLEPAHIRRIYTGICRLEWSIITLVLGLPLTLLAAATRMGIANPTSASWNVILADDHLIYYWVGLTIAWYILFTALGISGSRHLTAPPPDRLETKLARLMRHTLGKIMILTWPFMGLTALSWLMGMLRMGFFAWIAGYQLVVLFTILAYCRELSRRLPNPPVMYALNVAMIFVGLAGFSSTCGGLMASWLGSSFPMSLELTEFLIRWIPIIAMVWTFATIDMFRRCIHDAWRIACERMAERSQAR